MVRNRISFSGSILFRHPGESRDLRQLYDQPVAHSSAQDSGFRRNDDMRRKRLSANHTCRKLLALLMLSFASPAHAHSYAQDGIQIGHAWGLPTTSSETQVFFPILNTAKVEDRIISMTSPAAARVEWVVPGKAPQTRVTLLPNKPVGMRKGGTHLRLSGLKSALRHGDKILLTLRFAKARSLTIDVWIEPAPYAKP